MRKLMCGLATSLVLAGQIVGAEDKPAAPAPAAPAAAPAAPANDEETIYGMGKMFSQNLGNYSLTEKEFDTLIKGMRDGLFKPDPKFNPSEMMPKIQAFAQTRQKAAADKEKKDSADFLVKAAAEKGAVKTDSGLIFVETKAGTGESPKATDRVKVHYHGTLRDGTVFDSSVDRGTPATFPLNGVIKCWTEGVQKLKVGGKAKLICPSDIAYGDRGAPPKIKPGAALTFDVELIEILPPAAAPPAMHPEVVPSGDKKDAKDAKKDEKK